MLDMNFIGFCIAIKIFSGNFGLKNFIPFANRNNKKRKSIIIFLKFISFFNNQNNQAQREWAWHELMCKPDLAGLSYVVIMKNK